jgi:hypothetical protein
MTGAIIKAPIEGQGLSVSWPVTSERTGGSD